VSSLTIELVAIMNASPMKTFLLLICLIPLAFRSGPAEAGSIVHTGGGADLTFYYDSVNDSFDVVFQRKGNTVFTGGTPYIGPPGGVGGSSGNLAFDSPLTVVNNSPGFQNLKGVNYHTMGPSSAGGQTDLGMRTRFRELDSLGNTINQFDYLEMELDWANSSVPTGAEFAMWNLDGFGQPNVVRYETVTGTLTSNWANWGHNHWIYGFSKLGVYDLAFNIQGFLNDGTAVTSPGSFSLSISTVPEPTTTSLMILALGCLASGWRSRRRRGVGTKALATSV